MEITIIPQHKSKGQNDLMLMCRVPKNTDTTAFLFKTYLSQIDVLNPKRKGILMIIYMNNIKYLNKESRAFLKHTSLKATHKGVAILYNNVLTKMFSSFLVGLNKPDYPIEHFEDIEQAIEWLKRI